MSKQPLTWAEGRSGALGLTVCVGISKAQSTAHVIKYPKKSVGGPNLYLKWAYIYMP